LALRVGQVGLLTEGRAGHAVSAVCVARLKGGGCAAMRFGLRVTTNLELAL